MSSRCGRDAAGFEGMFLSVTDPSDGTSRRRLDTFTDKIARLKTNRHGDRRYGPIRRAGRLPWCRTAALRIQGSS
jgi:hypothetical protein